MRDSELSYVLQTLRGEKVESDNTLDWYWILGFLELNRVTGSFFYSTDCGEGLPQQVQKKLRAIVDIQSERNLLMSGWARDISQKLMNEKITHSFLKGAILQNAIVGSDRLYGDGARISNDIDILVNPQDITHIEKVLKGMGFVQGYYNHSEAKIVQLSRPEIISRRMNRGETAPYIQKLDNAVLPFVEIDINFSVDYLPVGNEKLLQNMLGSVCAYSNGLHAMSVEYFFLHLLMHQYKEMTLLSMVVRNKDAELYKYLDIYKMVSAGVIDWREFDKIIGQHGLCTQCYSVLNNVKQILGLAGIAFPSMEERVIDPENGGKTYYWQKTIMQRLVEYSHAQYLQEVRNA